MFILASLLLLVLFPLGVLGQQCTTCPHSFIHLAKWNKCYKVFNKLTNWINAYNTCNQLGAHLAVVRSENDSEALMEVTKSVRGSCISFHSSAKKCSNEFVWITGRGSQWRILYTNWRKGEPNNLNGAEDCLELVPDENMKWNDRSCNNELCFICEIGI